MRWRHRRGALAGLLLLCCPSLLLLSGMAPRGALASAVRAAVVQGHTRASRPTSFLLPAVSCSSSATSPLLASAPTFAYSSSRSHLDDGSARRRRPRSWIRPSALGATNTPASFNSFGATTSSSTLKAAEEGDTIFALSSGQGKAGVAVIRISGPQAKCCLEALTDPGAGSAKAPPSVPAPRVAALRRLYEPGTKELLDQALVLWFPGPRSFTGEDTVELQVHGSRAVVQGVTEALLALNTDGAGPQGGGVVRPADRGEFTERAFGNGRMDLTEVEGLADLIAADTAAQRKQALRQMGGSLRQTYEGWREELKVCLAHTEAVIDFGDDEEDVNESAYDAIRPRAAKLREELRRHLADNNRGEVIRSGIRVAIVGPPNAGKSTLLNLLARRPAAIVSPIPGTTRDVVEVQLELAGLPVLVSDTAGIREAAADAVEAEGIRRAKEAAGQAQLTLMVLDAATALGPDELRSLAGVGPFGVDAPPDDLVAVAAAVKADPGLLLVVNKLDAVAGSRAAALVEGLRAEESASTSAFLVSCATGEGVEGLLGGLQARLQAAFDREGGDGQGAEIPVITRARHRVHVERCAAALTAFLEDKSLGLDTAAEELRIASRELGRITGAVDVEEVLDEIFTAFCVGK